MTSYDIIWHHMTSYSSYDTRFGRTVVTIPYEKHQKASRNTGNASRTHNTTENVVCIASLQRRFGVQHARISCRVFQAAVDSCFWQPPSKDPFKLKWKKNRKTLSSNLVIPKKMPKNTRTQSENIDDVQWFFFYFPIISPSFHIIFIAFRVFYPMRFPSASGARRRTWKSPETPGP